MDASTICEPHCFVGKNIWIDDFIVTFVHEMFLFNNDNGWNIQNTEYS